MTLVFLFLEALFFTLGCGIGSFLNVVVDRGYRGERLNGRSYCESCKKKLSFFELIPIASFLVQKGRCRSCGTALSLQYPLVEFACGVLYALALFLFAPHFDYTFQPLAALFLLLAGIPASVMIAVSDLKYRIIPNGAVLTLLAAGVAASILRFSANRQPVVANRLLSDFSSALLIAAFLASLWFVSRGQWMGLGDAKLIFATSLIAGYPASLSAFLFAFWLGGGAGVILLGAARKNRKYLMPFGPFIIAGTVLAYFFSDSFLRASGLLSILP